MLIPQKQSYTEEDYYNIPEDVHADPGNDYIDKLSLYRAAGVREYWIVNPMKQNVLVYFFEQNTFDVQQYTFQENIKVNIYDDLNIDFQEIN